MPGVERPTDGLSAFRIISGTIVGPGPDSIMIRRRVGQIASNLTKQHYLLAGLSLFNVGTTVQLMSGRERRGGNSPVALCHL